MTVHILILAILSIIWGSSFILIKKGLVAFSPGQVGTLRIVIAFLVSLPIACKHLKTVTKKYWKKFFVFGMVSNLIPAILFALAETGLSSALAGVLNSLTPMFILLVGLLIFHIRVNRGQIIGLFVGLAGSVLLSFVDSMGHVGNFNYFALFVIIATICYGFSANMVKVYFQTMNSTVLLSLSLFSVGPIATVYLFSTDVITRLIHVDGAWSSLGYLFILGSVGTVFALILFYRLVQMTTPVFASIVTYLIPIAAVAWGVIDGETLFPLHFGSIGLIIFGVYIINRFK